MAMGSIGGTGGMTGIPSFLRSFRRRSLVRSFLKLSFFAAVANETVRWTAVLSNRWSDTDLPVLSIGPIVLAASLLLASRRWTISYTAAAADRALRFRDRLLSFVDFSSRGDLPSGLVKAQAAEAASSLSGVSLRRLVPLQTLLTAGPLLLAISVFYPNLIAPISPDILVRRNSPVGVPGPGSTAPAGDAGEKEDSEDRDRGPEKEGETPGDGETAPENEDGSIRTEEGPPGASVDDRQEDDSSRRRRPQPSGEHTEDAEMPVESKTIGEEVTKVVDPLYSPGDSAPSPAVELPGGTMTFRLLPGSGPAGGDGGENASSEGDPSDLVVDLEAVPERYRLIVSRYFNRLAGVQGTRHAP